MLAYFFVLFAILFRLIPHPWGFTPLTGSLLFFGARGSRRMMWLPLALMMACDVVLTRFWYALPITWDQYVTWVWYAAILWLGTRLKNRQTPLPVLGAALAGSASFFVVSNFAVWAATDLYPRSVGGLMTCYGVGLLHFPRNLAGDVLFTSAMFATPVVLQALSRAWDKHDHTAAA